MGSDGSTWRRLREAAALFCLLAALAPAAGVAEQFVCGNTEPPATVKQEVQAAVSNHTASLNQRVAWASPTIDVYWHVIVSVRSAAGSNGHACMPALPYISVAHALLRYIYC